MANKLIELLKLEGPQLAAEFDKASLSGRGTPQEIADRREDAVRAFLQRYFPFPYRVAKGNVIDSFGNESQSIDCLLLHPTHPFTVDVFDGKYSVIVADGVHAAVEVKPDIQDSKELYRGLEQLRSIRQLRRRESGILPTPFSSDGGPVYKEEQHRIPCILFAQTAKADPRNTAMEILSYYRDNAVPIHEQIDFAVINGRGIVANAKHPLSLPWSLPPGVYWEGAGENTLAAFLYHLNANILPPEAPMRTPILKFYLGGLPITLEVIGPDGTFVTV